MACKPRPCATQQTGFAYGCMAVQNDALAKAHGDRIAMDVHLITRFNFYPAIQFDMRVKMRRALFDFDPARRVKCFGGQESDHDFDVSNMSAKIFV